MIKTRLKEAPTSEPVTLAEMKIHLHCDADITTEDALISSLIKAAREHVEAITGRALGTQEWYAYLDCFPSDGYIKLPFGSLQSVSAVKYKDSTGVETTLQAASQYLVDLSSEPGRVVLPYAVSWPSFTPYPVNPITIEFTCGYDTNEDTGPVPESIKAAIKLFVADMYENRESQIAVTGISQFAENRTAINLITPYRLWDFY